MLTIKIKTDNAAFARPDFKDIKGAAECARILREIANRLENGASKGVAWDAGGQNAGSFELTNR